MARFSGSKNQRKKEGRGWDRREWDGSGRDLWEIDLIALIFLICIPKFNSIPYSELSSFFANLSRIFDNIFILSPSFKGNTSKGQRKVIYSMLLCFIKNVCSLRTPCVSANLK